MVFINKQVKEILARNQSWFLLALCFFVLGLAHVLLLGEQGENIFHLLQSEQETLQNLAEQIFTAPPLVGALLLFAHNFTTVLWLMFTGVILGIPPLLGLYLNGSLLGSVTLALSLEGADTLRVILLGILPHGLFELPAFFMATALGLKLGFHLIFPLPGKARGESLKHILGEMVRLLPFLMKLLLLAALIEYFITPHLLGNPF